MLNLSNEQPNDRAEKQTKAQLHKKATESAENISGMKRNQTYKMTFPPFFSQVVSSCPLIARVTSSEASEELGTISQYDNLRGITLVREPIWGFTLLP